MANEWTSTNVADHFTSVMAAGTLDARKAKMVMQDSVRTDWMKYEGFGNTYLMSRFANIETATFTEGTDITPSAYTDTKNTLTINKLEAAAIKLTDFAQLVSKHDVMKHYSTNMGYSLGRAVDVNLFTLPASFSQIVGSLGVELGYDDLLQAANYLADANVDITEGCTWIFHTQQYFPLLKIDELRHADYVGEAKAANAQRNGIVNMFLGAPVKTSTLVQRPAAGQHENMLFHKDAIALVMAARPKFETERYTLGLFTIAVASQTYGMAEMDVYSETPGNLTATDENAVLLRGK